MILYAIYKIQLKHFYYLGYQLQGGPRKELLFRNVVPGRAGRRGSPELSHSGGGFGRGMSGCWRWISVNLEYLLYIGFDYDLQLTRH
jgi:hypothetical protein